MPGCIILLQVASLPLIRVLRFKHVNIINPSLYSFELLYIIPLSEYTTVYLSILLVLGHLDELHFFFSTTNSACLIFLHK